MCSRAPPGYWAKRAIESKSKSKPDESRALANKAAAVRLINDAGIGTPMSREQKTAIDKLIKESESQNQNNETVSSRPSYGTKRKVSRENRTTIMTRSEFREPSKQSK